MLIEPVFQMSLRSRAAIVISRPLPAVITLVSVGATRIRGPGPRRWIAILRSLRGIALRPARPLRCLPILRLALRLRGRTVLWLLPEPRTELRPALRPALRRTIAGRRPGRVLTLLADRPRRGQTESYHRRGQSRVAHRSRFMLPDHKSLHRPTAEKCKSLIFVLVRGDRLQLIQNLGIAVQ